MTQNAESDAESRFARCLDETLKHEGGYANHPADPGGATKYGITRRTLAGWRGVVPWSALEVAAVKALDRDEAARIYRGLYWQRVAGDDLPAGLDLALFDFGVNSGPDRAIKALQTLLGTAADGLVGPKTLAAIRARAAAEGLAGLIKALCDQRLGFLERLATWATFGRGWSRRVAEIRAAALAMAGTALNQQRNESMAFLNGYKTYVVAAAMMVAALAQMLGVDLPAMDGQSAGHLLMEAFAVIFIRRSIGPVASKS